MSLALTTSDGVIFDSMRFKLCAKWVHIFKSVCAGVHHKWEIELVKMSGSGRKGGASDVQKWAKGILPGF